MGDVFMASINGDIDKLQQYVEYEGQSLTTRDGCGACPLHWASLYDQAHLIQYIIDQGGDVNAVDKGGRTALHWAASNGATDAADLLLQNGAWVEAADICGLQAVHVAANYGQTTFLNHITVNYQANFVAPDNKGKTPLHWAASCGCTDTIRQLLLWDRHQGRRRDEEGNTSLHWASFNGKLEACIVLAKVATKQQLSMQNKLGYTPAQLAFKRGHLDVGNFLESFDASISWTIFNQVSPSYATNNATYRQGRYERDDMSLLLIAVPANTLVTYSQEIFQGAVCILLRFIANTSHPTGLGGARNFSPVTEIVPDRTEEEPEILPDRTGKKSLKNLKWLLLTSAIYGILPALRRRLNERPTPCVPDDVNILPSPADNRVVQELMELLSGIFPKPNPVRTSMDNDDPLRSIRVEIDNLIDGTRKWFLNLGFRALSWLGKRLLMRLHACL